jgi:opacity protein-like surface antigen
MLRKLCLGIFGILLLAFSFTPAQAQWAVGASYEIRSESPETGFGARVENTVDLPVPMVNLGFRGYFSYFSEENQLSQNNIEYSQVLKNYDFGASVLGKVNIGLAKPYVGVGLGSSTTDLSYSDAENLSVSLEGDDDSRFAYHGLIGGEISLIPMLNPFIEYRFTDYSGDLSFDNTQTQIKDSNGRLIFGVTLRF